MVIKSERNLIPRQISLSQWPSRTHRMVLALFDQLAFFDQRAPRPRRRPVGDP
jgi:hypothetical protein